MRLLLLSFCLATFIYPVDGFAKKTKQSKPSRATVKRPVPHTSKHPISPKQSTKPSSPPKKHQQSKTKKAKKRTLPPALRRKKRLCQTSCTNRTQKQMNACLRGYQPHQSRCKTWHTNRIRACNMRRQSKRQRWCKNMKKKRKIICRSNLFAQQKQCKVKKSQCRSRAQQYCRWRCRRISAAHCHTTCIRSRTTVCRAFFNTCQTRTSKTGTLCESYRQRSHNSCLNHMGKTQKECAQWAHAAHQRCLRPHIITLRRCQKGVKHKRSRCIAQCMKHP